MGAGFSAPLGLPLTSNFLVKSRNMYSANQEKYQHLDEVYKIIRTISAVKNYFDADLFNIEEILSILQMEDYLRESRTSDSFKKYIADVVEYYTPDTPSYPDDVPANWKDVIFGAERFRSQYFLFVCDLLNININMRYIQDIRQAKHIELYLSKERSPRAVYSVVTLNYDLVFEMIIQYLMKHFKQDAKIVLKTEVRDDERLDDKHFYLAKLHGSVKPLTIVPPTWEILSNVVDRMIKRRSVLHT